jgi:hypothetical protein
MKEMKWPNSGFLGVLLAANNLGFGLALAEIGHGTRIVPMLLLCSPLIFSPLQF